jgi:hypothetical protein
MLRPGRGRPKRLDLVVGTPESGCLGSTNDDNPLRKSRIARPILVLETKVCMTAHQRAIPRLIDELTSSLDVIRAAEPNCIRAGVLLVNLATRFMSPLNRPGPNVHRQPQDAVAVITGVLERLPSGRANDGYDAFAIGLLDFDNERRIEAVAPQSYVAAEHTYMRMLSSLCKLYEGQRAELGEDP